MRHIPFADHGHSSVMLCVPGVAHAELLTTWINDQDLRQMLLRFAPVALEGEVKHLSEAGAQTARRHAITDAMYLIVEKKGRKPIGTIGLHQIDWKNRHALTGILLGKEESRGKGHGSDAYMLLLNWAFNELGLNSIEAHVIAYNPRSAACHRNCGYKVAGTLRERHFRHGRFHDEIIFEVLQSDWRHRWEQFEQGVFRKKREGAPALDRDRAFPLPG